MGVQRSSNPTLIPCSGMPSTRRWRTGEGQTISGDVYQKCFLCWCRHRSAQCDNEISWYIRWDLATQHDEEEEPFKLSQLQVCPVATCPSCTPYEEVHLQHLHLLSDNEEGQVEQSLGHLGSVAGAQGEGSSLKLLPCWVTSFLPLSASSHPRGVCSFSLRRDEAGATEAPKISTFLSSGSLL